MKKVAVLILNWNGQRYLEQFLEGVVSRSVSPDCEIIVVDNGSTDGSLEYLRKEFPEVRVIEFSENLGFAGGYTEALKQVKATYYVLLNSDVEVTEGWLEPVINYLDSNPDVAACQPKIINHNNRDHFEHAGAAGGYIDKFGFPFCRGRLFNNIESDRGQYDNIVDIFWASGACMFIKASVWNECGGLDPDFFAHMEEIDLCWRIQSIGYRISFIPDSIVYHVGGGTLQYDSPSKLYYNFRNNLYLLHKNLPGNNYHRLIFKRKLIDSLAAIRFLLKFQFWAFASIWKAHRDYSRMIETLNLKREAIIKKSVSYPEKLILNKSIVYAFYIERKRTYIQLMSGNRKD